MCSAALTDHRVRVVSRVATRGVELGSPLRTMWPPLAKHEVRSGMNGS